MPAQTQMLSVPFQGGMDQKTHPDYVQAGSQTSVVNGRFSKAGALHKRFGYTQLDNNLVGIGGGLYDGVARKLLACGGALCVAADAGLPSPTGPSGVNLWARTPGVDAWAPRGALSECVATWTGVEADAQFISAMDCAVLGGVVCVAYIKNAQTVATVYDQVTGGVLLGPVVLDSTHGAVYVRAVAIADGVHSRFVVAWSDNTFIYTAVMDFSTPASLAWTVVGATVTTNTNAGPLPYAVFDCCAVQGTPWIAFVYESPTVNRHVGVAWYAINATTIPSVGGVLLNETTTGLTAMAIASTSSTVVVAAYGTAADFKVHTGQINPTASIINTQPVVAYTSIQSSAAVRMGIVAGGAYVWVVVSDNTIATQWVSLDVNLNPAFYQVSLNHFISSKPFANGNKVYVQAYYSDPDNIQPTTRLLDLKADCQPTVSLYWAAREVARVTPRFSSIPGGSQNGNVCAPQYVGSGSPSSFNANQKWISLAASSISATGKSNIIQIVYDFNAPGCFQNAELGPSTYMAGGVPMMYDGSSVTEIGYSSFPDKVTVTDSGAGTNLVSGKNYQYIAVYEAWSSNGELIWSASSLPVTYTAGNAHSTSVQFNYLCITQRSGTLTFAISTPPVMSVTIWRTLGNGSIFYRATAVQVTGANVNQPLGVNGSVTDALSDAALALNQQWRMDGQPGSEVNNQCPPSLICLISHRNRLFGVSGDQRTIYYTKPYVPNVAANFADEMTFVVAGVGPLTALFSMDDKLVIFTADALFYTNGDGATADGQGSGLDLPPLPIRVPSDVGCIEPRSLVLTPAGVMFQSRIGIYLLGRDMSVSYIGKAVEDVLASYPIVTSAALVPGQTEVRFTARDVDDVSSSRHSVILVYNYLFQAWSYDQFHTTGRGIYSLPDPACSAVVAMGPDAQPRYTILMPDGSTYSESISTYKDQGVWVTFSVETAWLKLVQVGGYQRCRRVQVKVDQVQNHALTVQMGYNYQTAYVDSYTYSAIGPQPLTDFQFHVGPSGLRCQAIRIKISDAQGLSSQDSEWVFTNVSVEIATRPGMWRPNVLSGRR